MSSIPIPTSQLKTPLLRHRFPSASPTDNETLSVSYGGSTGSMGMYSSSVPRSVLLGGHFGRWCQEAETPVSAVSSINERRPPSNRHSLDITPTHSRYFTSTSPDVTSSPARTPTPSTRLFEASFGTREGSDNGPWHDQSAHDQESGGPESIEIGEEELTSAGRAKVNTTGLLTYGFINTIVNIPVMLSFSKIIFSDKFFQPYNDQLAKLVMVSAAVHSAGFCL
eukprot:CAMPEP_0198232752 /NCGR_PEP_ID=MMETSP1445-20131203/115894_1 /TAXON_ID=36898 /ORGANISM="Pyramimonas sp., Strain CCMP2087" /LENGTH=223 /DNA_ID=CAMNT_0043913437 /DNA_START=475 /DNA_END=1143 /DNA_ORIENTATION=-